MTIKNTNIFHSKALQNIHGMKIYRLATLVVFALKTDTKQSKLKSHPAESTIDM
jgi:hypothetical protein